MKSTFLAVIVCLLSANLSQAQTAAPASEHAWAMREIFADIQEMAGKPVATTEAEVWSMQPWTPGGPLVAFASRQLESHSGRDVAVADQYPRLTQATVSQLFAASAEVSLALKQDLRNPRAHEVAALILGAFGLLESAGSFSDYRWAMNRMTAHIAFAQALRGTRPMSVDGQIARATLATLVNRQSAALELIAQLGDAAASSPQAAWQRALLMRVKQDWRLLKSPASATRLEKLEYFRARRATLSSRRAGLELEALNEPEAADFARIVHLAAVSVDDGNQFVADSVVRELSQLAQVHQLEFKRTIEEGLPTSVNERARRLMSSGAPIVLPWGAWAEFSQRHLAMAVVDTDAHYRRMLGLPEEADELKAAIDETLEPLRMFSVASIGRRVGNKADTSRLREAIGVMAAAPEVITFAAWTRLEAAIEQAGIEARVPGHRNWFLGSSADVPFELSLRLGNEFLPLGVLDALVSAAPYSSWLLWRVDSWKEAPPELRKRADALMSERAAFDLWSLDREVARSTTRPDWERHLRRGCELSPEHCLKLADRLMPVDEHAAAVEYQRAIDNPALDRVTAANNCEWLVFFYERTNEPQRARALAETAFKTGSHRGMRTYARLLERRGDVDAAAKIFEAIADRYPTAAPSLAGFLYRRAVGHGDKRFANRWEEISKRTFPDGLVPETASGARPMSGVYVERDRPSAERVRLQVGDIIVGVDGWRVDNREQFEMVLAFNDQLNTHKVTAWRGVLFSVGVPTSHGLTLATYPNNPWAQ